MLSILVSVHVFIIHFLILHFLIFTIFFALLCTKCETYGNFLKFNLKTPLAPYIPNAKEYFLLQLVY